MPFVENALVPWFPTRSCMWWAPLLTPGAAMTLSELNLPFLFRPQSLVKVPVDTLFRRRGSFTFGRTRVMSTKSPGEGPPPCSPPLFPPLPPPLSPPPLFPPLFWPLFPCPRLFWPWLYWPWLYWPWLFWPLFPWPRSPLSFPPLPLPPPTGWGTAWHMANRRRPYGRSPQRPMEAAIRSIVARLCSASGRRMALFVNRRSLTPRELLIRLYASAT